MQVNTDELNWAIISLPEVSIGWADDPFGDVDEVDWVVAPVLLEEGDGDGVEVDWVGSLSTTSVEVEPLEVDSDDCVDVVDDNG
jgi:hypothetical protein